MATLPEYHPYQVQQLADREASRWVDEMAATRARDASLLSDELAEWVAKTKQLQAEVDELTKTFDTQLEARDTYVYYTADSTPPCYPPRYTP